MLTKLLKDFKKQSGISIVELLLAIGLSVILFPALLTGFAATRGGRAQQDQRIQAISLVQETQEAVRQIQESSLQNGTWTTFAVNGTYHPQILGSSWILSSGSETTSNGFGRSVVISDVSRDASGNIVTTGGTVDPSTKKLVTTVSWSNPNPASVTQTQYLSRYVNQGYVETTQTQFNSGTKNNITVRATTPSSIPDDGEVILGPSSAADWCKPDANLVSEFNLPRQGVALAVSAEVNRVIVGTGENSSGVSLADVNTTDPANPALNGTVNGYKTNGVFVEGNFGYVSTDTNNKEVVIVDLSSHQEVGSFDAPGNVNGTSVYVSNNIGYMITGNKLYNFDLSSKTGSRPQLDSQGVTLDGNGTEVMIVGDYAYVSIDSTSNQLNIVDISKPNNLKLVGRATVSGGAAKDVFVNSTGTRAYLVTEGSSSQAEFFIIDVNTKTGNSHLTIGSFDTHDILLNKDLDPTGLTIIEGDKRAIIVGKEWDGQEYIVVKLDDEASPSSCAGLNFNFSINGVSSVIQNSKAYSYIVTPDAGKELKIISGGTGAAGIYATSGVFESQTIPVPFLTHDVAFNSFSTTTQIPAPTTIDYLIAIKSAGGGDCSSVNFSDGDFKPYASPGPFPYNTVGQCVRYRAHLSTTDQNQTPTLFDITFNYSL